MRTKKTKTTTSSKKLISVYIPEDILKEVEKRKPPYMTLSVFIIELIVKALKN